MMSFQKEYAERPLFLEIFAYDITNPEVEFRKVLSSEYRLLFYKYLSICNNKAT